MRVKKTKSGKFSFELDYQERDEVASFFLTFLEGESFAILSVRFDKHPARHLNYSVLTILYHRIAAKLSSLRYQERFQINHAEAIALVCLLETASGISLRDVRAELINHLM